MRGKEHKQPQTKQKTPNKNQNQEPKHTKGQRPFLPHLKVFPLYQGDVALTQGRESCSRDWAEKPGGWLALIHDQCGPELREALRMEEPVADQELRARRLFHLIQQAFTGHPKIEHMIRNQIMARGAADANGYELFRLIRREFSIYSRQPFTETFD